MLALLHPDIFQASVINLSTSTEKFRNVMSSSKLHQILFRSETLKKKIYAEPKLPYLGGFFTFKTYFNSKCEGEGGNFKFFLKLNFKQISLYKLV